ncbi:hypothetical protein CPB83DRAFT_393844 [Crepidotus variabilis]|uniref:MATH domain-containing protein n=1 Tax=Crepidotus variabilis TaxID=179855 RepID=A0A9P6EEG7_9AGAR|nr:hypothetical protein CPB83DRAFT_393844 [Crepidotus variabilis]
MDIESEYAESVTLSFEWTLKGLKNLFDSTKGDKKSKVTKSVKFGNDKWQILFYANAGQSKEGSEGGFISLFLSCDPTAEEKERALGTSGRWTRDGVYKFSFELRNLAKTVLYNSKEAHNHTFTSKTANWGWPQFARRDSVFYQSIQARTQDAFVIICTITSSPMAPSVQTQPHQPVPKALLDTVGNLLDDPTYSDIKFVLAKRRPGIQESRTIWASKKMLRRTEYFEMMFGSNFSENSIAALDINMSPTTPTRSLHSPSSLHTSMLDDFEDSDDEDEDFLMSSNSIYLSNDDSSGLPELSSAIDNSGLGNATASDKMDSEEVENFESDPSTANAEISTAPAVRLPAVFSAGVGPPKVKIEVKDVAYTTYRAVLYYIYTDNIVFAPLSSSFRSPSDDKSSILDSTPSTPSECCEVPGSRIYHSEGSSSTRAEWIREWMKTNPGRPAPCSAKSVYRLADRLDLSELKDRAAQHIIKSLTVQNIALEIFSPFAATYEAIRKVSEFISTAEFCRELFQTEVEFFLTHWNEIRASDAMRDVWVQIRNGRHPGFEEVWPLIAQSLEFRPIAMISSQSSKSTDVSP